MWNLAETLADLTPKGLRGGAVDGAVEVFRIVDLNAYSHQISTASNQLKGARCAELSEKPPEATEIHDPVPIRTFQIGTFLVNSSLGGPEETLMDKSDQIIIGRIDSPIPTDLDVRLSVFLHGARFDFTACLTAALAFVEEWRHTGYFDAVDLSFDGAETLPRLPCERLYLEP